MDGCELARSIVCAKGMISWAHPCAFPLVLMRACSAKPATTPNGRSLPISTAPTWFPSPMTLPHLCVIPERPIEHRTRSESPCTRQAMRKPTSTTVWRTCGQPGTNSTWRRTFRDSWCALKTFCFTGSKCWRRYPSAPRARSYRNSKLLRSSTASHPSRTMGSRRI